MHLIKCKIYYSHGPLYKHINIIIMFQKNRVEIITCTNQWETWGCDLMVMWDSDSGWRSDTEIRCVIVTCLNVCYLLLLDVHLLSPAYGVSGDGDVSSDLWRFMLRTSGHVISSSRKFRGSSVVLSALWNVWVYDEERARSWTLHLFLIIFGDVSRSHCVLLKNLTVSSS